MNCYWKQQGNGHEQRKNAHLYHIAVSADRCVKDKETEKTDKYQELCLEMQKLWNMRVI